jgi:intracellular sulfur oxidation DsrE/DsrF family protein
MKPKNGNSSNPRREFLGTLTTGLANLSLAPGSVMAAAEPLLDRNLETADAWFNSLNGKHKVVFDVSRPNAIYPFVWPRVFLMTNGATGTPEAENNVVVVFRHDAIPYAFESRLWEKYKFGEAFQANDPATNKPALRNPFQKPATGDFKVPGVGNVAIGINELQASGVKFCVCDVALTVYSAALAQKLNLSAEAVKKDRMTGLLSGIQVVPSGVWALGRAQEKGCGYVFAG